MILSKLKNFIFILSVFIPFVSGSQSTVLTNGTVNAEHDYHCVCSRLSNSTGKDVLIPWKTSTEWANFRSNTYTGLTKAACISAPSAPAFFDFADSTTTGGLFACIARTNTVTFSGLVNGGPYSLKVEVASAFYSAPQVCTATAYVNNGGGFNTTIPLPAGINTVNVCQNSQVFIDLSCATEANHGPYLITIYNAAESAELDAFTVEFFFYGTGCGI